MKFVDAHIHLSDAEYSCCADKIVHEASSLGIVAILSNSTDLKTSLGNLELARRHPGLVYAALGVHPSAVRDLTPRIFGQISELITEEGRKNQISAIGEIGLDSRYETSLKDQEKVFGEMLHVAEDLGLPVIVHSRGMANKIIEILSSYRIKKILLHWFSDSTNVLSKALEKGYFISEGPLVVYSNGIREIVKETSLTSLLTETDGPVRFFRSPFTGKKTTPMFIPRVIEEIAKIKNVNVESVARQIVRNFEDFCGLKLS